mmetsp:Transcript_16509/g.49943  ORF Transcript_16509/g.49943 Transcript_16509/m.49943 type:complete len:493 (+) Transcript_16509:110-1588(+)
MVLDDAELAQVRAYLLEGDDDAFAAIRDTPASADVHWLLFCGTLVFFMQAGFAMLCAGSIRAKNVQNILLKNLLDACVGALGFWSLGYGVAYGRFPERDRGNEIVGSSFFMGTGQIERRAGWHNWFFQFAFAATAATIVSGAVAERCAMSGYAGYAFFLTTFVYPVVAHWIWSDKGFLSAFKMEPYKNVGCIDFAGCGVVHMVGGAAAGIGAYVLGPRIGRFDPNVPVTAFRGHSAPLTILGTFILWVGWYGFNPGSTLAIVGSADVASKVAVCTTLSAAAGGVTNMLLHFQIAKRCTDDKHGIYDVAETCNGVLAGLVSITSACAVVEPWASVVIGLVGALVYSGGSALLKKLEIDDAVNATPVHFFAGAWGLLTPGLFARGVNMRAAYGNHRTGLFYGGNGTMLAVQALALVAITLWCAVTMFPFFVIMKKLGLFRVAQEHELLGLDESKHGGSAYANDDLFKSSPKLANLKKTQEEEAKGGVDDADKNV